MYFFIRSHQPGVKSHFSKHSSSARGAMARTAGTRAGVGQFAGVAEPIFLPIIFPTGSPCPG
jgi:hypothetical protein